MHTKYCFHVYFDFMVTLRGRSEIVGWTLIIPGPYFAQFCPIGYLKCVEGVTQGSISKPLMVLNYYHVCRIIFLFSIPLINIRVVGELETIPDDHQGGVCTIWNGRQSIAGHI